MKAKIMVNMMMVAFVLWGWAMAHGQKGEALKSESPSSQSSSVGIKIASLEDLKADRDAIAGSQTLSDSAKKDALALTDQAIRLREQLEQIKKSAAVFSDKIATAPARIDEIKAELQKQLPTHESIQLQIESSDMGLDQVEQKIQQETASLSKMSNDLSQMVDELDKAKARPQDLRGSISSARDRIAELDAQLKIATPPDESNVVTEARRVSIEIERALRKAEIQANEQRLATQDLYLSLLSAEKDLLEREIRIKELWVKAWKEKAQELRKQEASKAKVDAAEAQLVATEQPEEVQKQLKINADLAKDLDKLIREEVELEKALEAKKIQLKALEDDFALAEGRTKNIIRTEAIGLALREQREELPNFAGYRRNSAKRRQRLGDLQNALFGIHQQSRSLTDIGKETGRIMESLGPLEEEEIISIKAIIGDMLNDRQNLLVKLRSEYSRQFRTLQSIEFTDQRMVQIADQFAQFLDINLMWIRSSRILGPKVLGHLPGAVKWVASPRNWYALIEDLGNAFVYRPVLWILGLFIGWSLMAWRKRARKSFPKIAQKVGQVQTDSFMLTLRALVLTCYLAAGWPFILAFLGWQLSSLPMSSEFSLLISAGLFQVALGFTIYMFFRVICYQHGLAQAHFRWPEEARLSLQINMQRLIYVLLVVVFLMNASDINIEFGDSLGRIGFILGAIAVSLFMARLLRFSGGIVSPLIENHPTGLLTRLRFIWYLLAVGIPLAMAVLAVFGYYYYTAITLVGRVLHTFELVIVLVIIKDLMLRWLYIANKRHAYEEAKRKAEKELAKVDNGESVENHGEFGREGKPIVIQEPEISLDQIDEQSRALIRMVIFFSLLIGLWTVWYNVIPAIRSLVDIPLWSYSTEVGGVTKIFPVTLSHLILALVAAVTTVTASRNLPGVLEITLLKRLGLDSGSRYAYSTICRYTITAVGFIVVLRMIGLRWGHLQWLIAALGVGLGFGLQEIVANFICGLIILFERPYRVGDIVTVGETSGAVTRIRIRATTITDWDRHELIVPNKEFITGKLINWTLSDPIERIIIPVGIGHGSDTALAEKVLIKVARENSMVLDQPEPSALFLGIEENCHKFELRVFVHGVDKRLPAMHQLHQAVDNALRDAGIQIAFPQRDVHLDSKDPVDVRVVTKESFEGRARGEK